MPTTPIPMDFPASPYVGQIYVNYYGTSYIWDGTSWQLGTYQSGVFTALSDLINQIRVTLLDQEPPYRYSTDSIISNINMGLIEMFRIRPDIFLALDFVVPMFRVDTMTTQVPIEQQWVPSLIYYAVGMTQMRDDEGTQDTRASAFLTKFTSTLVAVA